MEVSSVVRRRDRRKKIQQFGSSKVTCYTIHQQCHSFPSLSMPQRSFQTQPLSDCRYAILATVQFRRIRSHGETSFERTNAVWWGLVSLRDKGPMAKRLRIHAASTCVLETRFQAQLSISFNVGKSPLRHGTQARTLLADETDTSFGPKL